MTATSPHRGRLGLVLAITGAVFVAEVIGGLLSGSLALLADAGHMLTDATGLVLALVGAGLATRAASGRRTYGMQRAEVLAALSNALLLVGVAVWVAIQAVDRLRQPAEVDTGLMLAIAVVGVLANAAGLVLLHRGQADSLNVRGAYLEVLADLFGSVAVIIAAVLIMVTGWTRFDSLASLLIFGLIVPRAWALLREVVDVLLEATPRGVDLDQIRLHIKEVPGVVDVHDLHVWAITSGVPVISAHVVVDDACISQGRSGQVLDRLSDCLGGHFDVEHCTFQLEPVGHQDHEPISHA
ncbi:MAG TPA: cation diffusion facilitator family transporter [Propionibacteriaceae bacterium]|nr:cation diffusion facilitator family transporter [Propionibacteriaceae bacterium]